MAKRNRKIQKNRREIVIKTISVVAILIVLLIVYNFIKNIQTIKISNQEHEFFQYVMGNRIEYTGVLEMTKKDGITELKTEEGTLYLDSIPVYYKDKIDKVILPSDMAVAFPMNNGTLRKINGLSNVYIEYGDVYVEKGNLNKELYDAFLYDGSDLYFFIENTNVEINGIEYKLSPLSYITVTHKGYVEFYDYNTDSYTYIEEVKGDVIATTSKYTINLSIDVLQYEGKEQLLLKRIKNLTNLE